MTETTSTRQGRPAAASGALGANGASDPNGGQAGSATADLRAPDRAGELLTRPALAERARRTAMTVIRRDSTVRRALALADVAALTGATLLAVAVGGYELRPLALAVAMPALVLVAKVMGLYDRDANVLRRSTLDELPALFHLATLAALVAWLAAGTGSSLVGVGDGAPGEMNSPMVLAFWAGMLGLMCVLRSTARALARRASAVERCLFVGDPDSAAEFQAKLATSRGVKAEVVDWIPTRREARSPGELAAQLAPRVRQHAIDGSVHRVVLAPGPGSSEELVDAIRRIRETGLKVSVLPRHSRVAGSAVVLDDLDGLTLLGVRRFHITHSSRLVKRGFDLAGATFLLALSWPLLVGIAVAIRLDSRGPALFRHRRTGLDGRTFEMLKFRSMFDGAQAQQDELTHLNQADGVFKLRDDPRVTRIGRFLRAHSLDELPQLINVLRGDMSLVGPRPLPVEEDSRIEGWQRRRLDLRPGMTGPWQVLGSTRVSLREMANLDNQYVADWSLWTDFRILLLTLSHVAGRRGI